MSGVVLACVAGMFLGALNVTMRGGLMRGADVDAGSAVIATLAFALGAATALVSGTDFDPGELWAFLLLGVFVPGLSQLLVVHAVGAAGASRAGIRQRASGDGAYPRVRCCGARRAACVC